MEFLEKCPVCGNKKQKKYLGVKDWFLSREDFEIKQCENCGFLFTNPRPYPERLGDYYKSEEYISHSNTNRGLINRLYKMVRAYTLKQKYMLIRSYKSGGSILDVGCGTGELLNVFAKNGWEVKGVEPDEDAKSFAINEYHLPVIDEEEIQGLNDESFDVISMWHVLEHVPNINERIDTLKRLLKKDGVLIVAVPNPESHDAETYQKYWAAYDVPRHLYHFRKTDIENLFSRHGYELDDIVPLKFDSFYVSMLSQKYKKGKPCYISAFKVGLNSNIKAKMNMNYSSLIYTIKKA